MEETLKEGLERLTALVKRVNGPWKLVEAYEPVAPHSVIVGIRDVRGAMVMRTRDDRTYNPDDALLVEAAVNILPRLLQYVTEIERDIELTLDQLLTELTNATRAHAKGTGISSDIELYRSKIHKHFLSLEADRDRLDWIEAKGASIRHAPIATLFDKETMLGADPVIRKAIDQAMASSPQD